MRLIRIFHSLCKGPGSGTTRAKESCMAGSINVPVYSDALVVLGAAGVIVPLLRRSGISPVLGYLGAGALLGPLGLGSFISQAPFLYWFTVVDEQRVADIAELGVVFLMFVIGLELSFERLMSMRRLVFGLGGLQVILSAVCLAAALLIAGQTRIVALLLGACLALSSTAIVLEVLAEQGRMKSGAGRASFSILLAQDLAVVPLLLLISILGADKGGSIALSIGVALAQAAAAVAIIVFLGRIIMRPVFRVVAGTRSNELMIAAILFVIIGSGFVAALEGLSMTLGAFVAGLLLAETAYRKTVEATVEPFKGLLLGVFFLTVGMKFDVRVLLAHPALLVTGVVALVTIKALIIFALAKIFRLGTASSFETALLLGPGGEFAFVGIGTATSLGLFGGEIASLAIAVTTLSMVLIPILAIAARRSISLLEARKEIPAELNTAPTRQQKHAIVIGYGRTGKVVCEMLKRNKTPCIAVDYNAATVIEDRRAGRDVYFGDATRLDFLNACGLMEAAGVIVTIDEKSVIDKIVAQVREARPDIHLVSRARDAEHARHLYAIGVTDAVPETIEASLQLSEAALIGLGVPTGHAIVSVHAYRDDLRKQLQEAARLAKAAGVAP